MAKSIRLSKRTPERLLGFLLRSHYLADDFPRAITTANFAVFCTDNYASLETVNGLLGRTTLYGTFSAPRTTTTRRVLALPHPTSQLALSLIITRHYDEIRAVIKGSKITLYNTAFDATKGRAFLGVDFAAQAEREPQILARCPVVMTADIANFFHTIYSHSLPWAVLGKQHVKDVREGLDKDAKRKLDTHWATQIDMAIQRGNSRETFGIPVGPDTSRIIAEILLSGIHKNEMFKVVVDGRPAYRLVDDFFIGFEDEGTAQKCLDALRQALWDFNLHLNDAKTRIIRSSTFFDAGWKYEIDNFRVPDDPPAQQRDAVRRLLDMSVHYCETLRDARPASFFCRRLLSMKIALQNFAFVRDCILRVARDFTVCLKFAAEFITQYRHLLNVPESREAITQWARLVLKAHAQRAHDLEVSWILLICGVLGLPVSQSFIGVEARVVSPVVLAVLGLLSGNRLLAEDWDEWRTPALGTGSIANGRNWLPYYEAVLRGWTTDLGIQGAIKADPLFSRLLDAKVTFLDDSDFLSRAPTVPLERSRRHGGKSRIAPRTLARRKRARDRLHETYD